MNCPKCGNEMSLGWMIPGKICQLEWPLSAGNFPFPARAGYGSNPPRPQIPSLTLWNILLISARLVKP